jgi:hypothetical protein
MKLDLIRSALCAAFCAGLLTPIAQAAQQSQEDAVRRERIQAPVGQVRRTAPATQSNGSAPSTPMANSQSDATLLQRIDEIEQRLEQACSNMSMTFIQPYEVTCDNNPQVSFYMQESCTLTSNPANPGSFPSCNLVQAEPCERDLLGERAMADTVCSAVARLPEGEVETEGGDGDGEGVGGGGRDPDG